MPETSRPSVDGPRDVARWSASLLASRFGLGLLVAAACGSPHVTKPVASPDKDLEPREVDLIRAAERGDLATVQSLVSAGVDVRGRQRLHPESGRGFRVVREEDLGIEAGWDALMAAACSNRVDVVEFLLANGAVPNTREHEVTLKTGEDPTSMVSYYAATALVNAADRGHLRVVELLLRHGADPQSANCFGHTALIKAASQGHADVVQALLARGADPARQGSSFGGDLAFKQDMEAGGSHNALHYAAQAGDEAIVRLLLDAGADPGASGAGGETPLSLASKEGHAAVVRLLLEHRADPKRTRNAFGLTPLLLAAERGHADVVKALLDHGADVDQPDESKETPLMEACQRGRSQVVDVLLAHGAKLESRNSDGQSAAELALAGGHFDVVETLRKRGAKVSDQMLATARLYAAIESGDVLAVRDALSNGADKEGALFGSGTPLKAAVFCRNTEVVRVLLDAGVKVDASDPRDRWTALDVLAGPRLLEDQDENLIEIAELLVERGASVRRKDPLGRTVLHQCARSMKGCLFGPLIRAGADPNATDNDGVTPLMISAGLGTLKDLRALVEAGADVNAADEEGDTPLHSAVEDPAKLSFLIQKGAEVNVRDRSGKSPLDYARHRGVEAAVSVLLSAGAK